MTNVAGQQRPVAPLGVRPPPEAAVSYRPILDVARGRTAGYQAQAQADPAGTADLLRTALATYDDLPPNTFLSLPLPVQLAADPEVRDALQEHALAGTILDIVGSPDAATAETLLPALAVYRRAGALIAVGGYGAPQPELGSIIRLKPAIIRLGRDWVRGIDRSDAKRRAVEVIGRLAGQLDAWILAEGVDSAAELRVLADLEVPLAQGPFVGGARPGWPQVEAKARSVLPLRPEVTVDSRLVGALAALVHPALTVRHDIAASVSSEAVEGADVLVTTDEHGHPCALRQRVDDGSWETADVLAVNVTTPVAEAAQRAMLRPRSSRFVPMVCVDDLGAVVGVVRIDVLLRHLADQS